MALWLGWAWACQGGAVGDRKLLLQVTWQTHFSLWIPHITCDYCNWEACYAPGPCIERQRTSVIAMPRTQIALQGGFYEGQRKSAEISEASLTRGEVIWSACLCPSPSLPVVETLRPSNFRCPELLLLLLEGVLFFFIIFYSFPWNLLVWVFQPRFQASCPK